MNDACRYREKGEKQKGGCPCTPTTVRSGRGTVGTGGDSGQGTLSRTPQGVDNPESETD